MSAPLSRAAAPLASAAPSGGDDVFWSRVAARYVTAAAAALPVLAATVRGASTSQWRDDVAMLRGAGLLVGQPYGTPSAWLTSAALLLPGGPAHFRGAMVSALASGLAGALVVHQVRKLTAAGGAPPLVQLALALIASLTFTLSPTVQGEATIAGGTTLAVALGLAVLALGAGSGATPRRFVQGAVFALLLAESAPAAAAVACCGAAHALLTRHRPERTALVALLAGFSVPTVLLVVGVALRPLSPSLWVDVGRGLFAGGLSPLDVETMRLRALPTWMADVGVFPVLTGAAGVVAVIARPSLRVLGAPLAILLLPDLLVPVARTSLLTADPLGAMRGLSVASFAILGAAALQTTVAVLSRSRLPFAKGIIVLVLAFSAAITAIASEEATLRVDRSSARSAEAFTDEALERLPPRALVLVRSDATAYRLWAARLVRGQRPDVTVIPVPLLTRGRVAQRALAEEPASAALLRDLSARGAPGEYALSALADARPLFVELDPGWDRALASHTAPSHLWLRFASQPLGPSDRRALQGGQDTSRARVRGALTPASSEDGGYPDLSSEATLEVLSERAREEVAAAALVGDAESARRSLAALSELREEDTFAATARTRLATARRGLDLRGLLRGAPSRTATRGTPR